MATGAPTKRDVTTKTSTSSAKGSSGKNGSDENEEAVEEKKKGGKMKLIIIAVLVLVLAGGGYFMFLKPKGASAPPTPQAGKIVQMDATTLNLADGHYLKLQVALELTKTGTNPTKAPKGVTIEDETTFDNNEAAEIIMNEFSNRPTTDMDSEAKRDALKKDLLTKLNKAYYGAIFDLYFITFVSQ